MLTRFIKIFLLRITFSLGFLLLSVVGFSQNKNYQAPYFADANRVAKIKAILPVLDELYKTYAIKNNIPGLAFGLVVDGKLIHQFNYGYSNIQEKIPVSSQSVFRIASMSKSFAAMAILQLRDAGKLQLDDAVSKYIPALKQVKLLTTDAPAITIRHLLTHGAGFPEDNPWGDRQLADTDDELMTLLKNQLSFSTTTGTAYEYSNLGFALLGRIITVVSGKPYQQYIKEKIWAPLGMKQSEWEYANVPAKQLAHGYRWIYGNWREEELLHDKANGSWGAMGGMLTSIEDFANYIAMHINAWPPNNQPENKILKRSSIREMHHPWRVRAFNPKAKCPSIGAYAYGLVYTKDCTNREWISHSGGLPGFGSQWRFLPEYGIGIVAFANRTYAGFGDIHSVALDSLVQLANLQPRVLPASIILEQRKNELVTLLQDWKNYATTNILAENFRPDYPLDLLQKESKEIFDKAGKIITVSNVFAENQLRGSFILTCEKEKVEIYFTLSPEVPALVQEYRIRLIK
jgi:CubicO group peptidase (beta-lactamase class C family)